MGQRTQILLQVVDNKGNVQNKLYHHQWGFAKTMPIMLMRLETKLSYLMNTYTDGFNFLDFVSMDGWDISNELDKADINAHLPLDCMATMERVLDGHDNNNGYMVVKVQQSETPYHYTTQIGFLKGLEDTRDENELFKGYISAREYMEQFGKKYCPESFIKSFELFCETFEIKNINGSLIQQPQEIDRVITVYLDPDKMEEVNIASGFGVSEFETSNWCDLSVFEYDATLDKDTKKLIDYITPEQYKALKDGQADYIVFKLDY